MNKSFACSRYSVAAAALSAAFFASASTGNAATHTWVGGNSSMNPSWGATGNFSPTFVTGNTTDLDFNTSAVPIQQTTLGGNRTVRSISFGGSVTSDMGVNLQDFNTGSARTLTLDTDAAAGNATLSILSGSSGNITFGNATSTSGGIGSVILADNLVVDHNGSGRLNFNRAITGAGFGITKNGSGTMVFNSIGSSPNTFSGNLTINSGKLIANGFVVATDFNNASSVNLGGGALEISSVSGADKNYTVALNVNSDSVISYKNLVNTTYTLTFSGNNSFALNGNLTIQNISSNTTIANPVVVSRRITGLGSLIVKSYSNITSTSNSSEVGLGRIALSGNNTGWSGNLVVNEGTVNLFGNSTLGNGVQTNVGTGSIILGETSNSLSAGLVLAAATGGGVQTITNNIIVRSGGYRSLRGSSDHTYNLNGNITLEGNLNVHNGLFFTDKRIILNGNISGPGGLFISESGNPDFIRLTGNNTYSGSTTVGTNATLSILSASSNAIPDMSGVTLESGSALTVSSNETVGSLQSSGANGTVLVGSNNTLTVGMDGLSTTYGGAFTGAGTLNKVGAGTLTLSGNNTAVGATTISEGILKVGSASALGYGGLQTGAPLGTTVAGGATLDLNGITLAEPIVLNGNGVGGNGALINTSGTSATIAGGVVGLSIANGGSGYAVAPAIIFSGTGSGANATASMGVTAASISLTNGGSGWVVGDTFTVNGGGSGAIFTVTGVETGAITTYELTASGTGYTTAPTTLSRITGAGTGATITGNASNFTLTGYSIVSTGEGYNEATTYAFDAGNAAQGAVTLASVTLASDSTVGGSGDITIQAPVTESGGSHSLNKVGAGALTLIAPAYSGNTTVTAGKLSLSAPNSSNQASTVSIASGAVLELNFAGSDTVDKLFLSGIQQPAGSYTSAHGSGAFQGTGSLVVTSSPVSGDTIAPVITLNGSATVSVNWGSTYTDAGASATDNVDTVVSVITSGSVNTSEPGIYTLTYNASDVANNAATPVTRTVTVSIANATTPGADGLSPLMKYAFGANSPSDTVQAPITSASATELSLTAVVRTNDTNLTVSAETNTDLALAASWTGTGITETLAADQTNLPAGCVRKVYRVSITGASKKFLRIKAVNAL
jgi:trimeric autotransporter adhesin